MNSIGIDLGTTNSVACFIQHGRFQYLNFAGKDLLPSAILYNDGKVTVGSAAKRRSKINADHYISSAKTFMGDHSHTWSIDNRVFTATDVACEVLKEIYKTAQKVFGNTDEIEAVITVPAQFSFDQIAETKKACEMAGFKVKRILAEPIAAAMAYAFDNTQKDEKIYVVDLGGGTFDVALLERKRNCYKTLMKSGDRFLGGDDFDQAVVNLMMSELRKTIGVDLSKLGKSSLSEKEYAKTQQRLFTEAEKIKCSLSYSEEEHVDIVNLFPYQGGYYDLHMLITRDDFLREAASLVRKVENVIRQSFDEIEFDEEDVDRIILVGGSAKMPFVRECVQKLFHKEPYSNMDLSKLVAMGAAIKADDELGIGIEQHDIISHSFGIELVGNHMEKMLKKNEEYPCERTQIFYTVHDYQKAVDVRVYEGEEIEDVTRNRYIGGFVLDNIERAVAGKEIEVRFQFDEDSILHVMARDPKQTNVYKEIKLDPKMKKQPPEVIKATPYDIVLLLDNSGSMYDSLSTAKAACHKLVSEMIDTSIHRVAFVTFESVVHLHCNLTHDSSKLIASINSIGVGGSTNMSGALRAAYQELKNCKGAPLVILVTDGYPDNKSETTEIASRLKTDGVKITAIGAGSVDHGYLTSLTSSQKDYYPIKNMDELAAAFQSIANGLRLY